tara:strand:+ start:462 stop:656 length:195 start_codon:yes stop_codon:yes gene_type:complete
MKKLHKFEGGNMFNEHCQYCEKSYLSCLNDEGYLGECEIGKTKDQQLKEDALILVKALRILKND